MIYAALIAVTIFALWQWWRKRVYKRRFDIAVSQHMPTIVNAFSEMWASAYRETIRDEWPDEIETNGL